MSKLYWSAFLLLTFIVTLPVSWYGLSKIDFAYPYLYEQMNVEEHISKYAPQNNKNKLGFEQTSKSERLDLFHGVSLAINNHGNGLDALSYNNTSGAKTRLFTDAEVTHLQDVANLIDKLKILVIVLVVMWLLSITLLKAKKISLPSSKQFLFMTIAILLVLGGILALGPEKIFNQLHVWVFPDNHQWYFYYQESLMSTMMKAPDLFAYIAAIWLMISIVLTALLLSLVKLKL